MIKVRIENFQSIKDIQLGVKGLTLLTGPNNSGKSACQRAIGGALHNMAGDYFVRKGAQFCKVNFNDGDLDITWAKGSGENSYNVNGVAYDKMGHDTPPILKEKGYYDFLVDGDSYPIQVSDQFDPPFAVSKTPSKMGAYFAAITKTDVLNKASMMCSRDAKRVKLELNKKREELKVLEGAAATLSGTPQKMADVEVIKTAFTSIQTLSVRKRALESKSMAWGKCQGKLSALEGVGDVSVPEVKLEQNVARAQRLKTLLGSLIKVEGVLSALKDLSEVVEPRVELLEAIRPRLLALKEKCERLKRLSGRYVAFRGLEKVSVSDIDMVRLGKLKGMKEKGAGLDRALEAVVRAEKEYNSVESSYIAKEKSFRETYTTCPLCDAKMGECND